MTAQPPTRVWPVLGRTTPCAWCPHCALPSAITGNVYGLPDTPGTTLPDAIGLVLARVRICTECGEVTRGLDD